MPKKKQQLKTKVDFQFVDGNRVLTNEYFLQINERLIVILLKKLNNYC
jgi:hypothetical protein